MGRMWGSPQGATFKPWGMGVDVSLPAHHWEDSEASSSQNLRTSQNQQD